MLPLLTLIQKLWPTSVTGLAPLHIVSGPQSPGKSVQWEGLSKKKKKNERERDRQRERERTHGHIDNSVVIIGGREVDEGEGMRGINSNEKIQ